MSKSHLDVVTVVKPNLSIWPISFNELWRWRETFIRLVIREFQVRFRETHLGYFWIVLQPLITLTVIMLFMPPISHSEVGVSYKLYVLSGLVFWFFIANGFSHGSVSLLDNGSLIMQTSLKRVIIPASIVASKLFDLIVAVIVLAFFVYFDPNTEIKFQMLFIFLDVVGIFFLLMGVVMFFSALCVHFKDIRYIMPFLAQTLFFSTPVFYTYPENIRSLALILNPFSIFILAIRDHLFDTSLVTTREYLSGFLLAIIVFVIGSLIFKRMERKFADVL